ncbi:MAG: anthranilate phosphoribosyltransferase, partial [Erythrobacter sp.]
MKRLPDAKQHLGEQEAEEIFGWILDGETSDEDIARFLVDMSARSETSDEIAGAARALRARLIPVDAPEGTVDCCGTGGDGHH